MSIITTQAELIALTRGRAQTNLSIDVMTQVIEEAEQIVARAMSEQEFAALQAAYDASPPPALPASPYDVLLPKAQKAVILYAIVIFKRETLTTTGNAGSKETGTEETMPARQWAFNVGDRSMLNSADAALEKLLEFLELNASTYTDWEASPARLFRTELLVNSPLVLSETTSFVNTRTAYLRLRPFIADAEQLVISKSLGAAYYQELITEAKDDTMTAENAVVYRLAQKASVYQAIANAVITYALKQNSSGNWYAPNIEDGNRKDIESKNEALVQMKEQMRQYACDYIAEYRAILDPSPDGEYTTYKSQVGVYTPPPTSAEVEVHNAISNLKTFGF